MEFLSRKGVPFTERNITRDPGARDELLAMRMMSVPVIVVGERTLVGFNPIELEAALADAGVGGL